MKKAFLVLMMMAVCGNAFAAELLVQAKPHWMDSLTEKEVAEMDESTRQNYEARSKIGDVIAVRPDGWAWGKEEGLPNYVVVKVPMTVEEAQKYEEQLVENVQYESVVDGKSETITAQVLKRRRKYTIPETYVSTAKTAEKTDVSIASKDVTAFKSAIIEKVGLSAEVKPPVKDTIKTDLQSFYKKHLQKYVAVARTFWIENAWAATQLKKTVCPSGCDYTALETCMNANEQNLVTADKYFDVEISGEWSSADTTNVVIHNYTTDATRYINIYTTVDARHTGVASTSKYLLSPSSSGNGIGIGNSYVTIDGVQATGITGNYTAGISVGNNSNCVIKNNIIYNTSNLGGDGISTGTLYPSPYIYNNIVYEINGASDGTHGGISSSGQSASYVYNNTVYGCTRGFIGRNGQTVLKNNIGYNNGVDFGAYKDTSTNNLSKDDTAPPVNTYYTKKTLSFVSTTSGSENFHLVSTDTDAIDKGADLSGTFTTDIDGKTRSGTWDIGADEYVSYYPFKQFNHGIMTGVF